MVPDYKDVVAMEPLSNQSRVSGGEADGWDVCKFAERIETTSGQTEAREKTAFKSELLVSSEGC